MDSFAYTSSFACKDMKIIPIMQIALCKSHNFIQIYKKILLTDYIYEIPCMKIYEDMKIFIIFSVNIFERRVENVVSCYDF